MNKCLERAKMTFLADCHKKLFGKTKWPGLVIFWGFWQKCPPCSMLRMMSVHFTGSRKKNPAQRCRFDEKCEFAMCSTQGTLRIINYSETKTNGNFYNFIFRENTFFADF